MYHDKKSVFFDQSGNREKVIKGLVLVSFFGATLGAVVIALGIFYAPKLPNLDHEVAANLAFAKADELSNVSTNKVGFILVNRRSLPALPKTVKRFAFFADDDAKSIASLRQNAAKLDALIPSWVHIENRKGEIAQRSPKNESNISQYLKSNAPHLEIYPRLKSRLDKLDTVRILMNRAKRDTLIAGLTQYLHKNNYPGITIDASDLPDQGSRILASFLNELKGKLQPQNRKIIVTAQSDKPVGYYQDILTAADYLLVSIHNEHFKPDVPGPVASQGWFEANIVRLLGPLDRAKLIIGIGSYGYDWSAKNRMKQISVQAAWDLLKQSNTKLGFNLRTLNPSFNYIDHDGLAHDVWFLDGTTVYNQLLSTLAAKPAGVALWRLGLEDPSLWASFGRSRLPDDEARSALETPSAGTGYAADDLAKPVFISEPGKPGSRKVIYNKELGLIVGQSMTRTPVRSRLNGWAAQDRKAVALTFDDGPDDVYTRQILDILAEKSLKATFFVTGINSLQSPHVLKQIYDQGHDLGNHSFSHPNLFHATSKRIEIELNATQRVLESQLGIRSLFFRAPYTSNALWSEWGAGHLVETASKLGYAYANISVDSDDWALIPAARIKDRVIKPVVAGLGQIVLLHDSGGNRSQTVKALPEIIDTLRAQGYRFVTLHELLGKSRQEVMPTIEQTPIILRLGVNVRSLIIRPVVWLAQNMQTIAIVVTALGGLRLFFIMIAACFHKRRERRRKSREWWPNKVAVLIPAYNEERVVCKTIQSLLQSNRTDFDILVIDDGSSDRTAQVARDTFADDDRIAVYRTENGGKASALNFGLLQTDADVVVAIDADTVLAPDAIELLVRHFRDTFVGAVAGTAVVGNQINLITRFQALEYVTSQNLDRRAFEMFNCIGVVPGAIGAWRRTAVLDAGGYSTDTLAEDAELTIAIERRGWTVLYEPRSRAWTEAPETLRAFLKQRFRWMFGTLQVAWAHSGAMLSEGESAIGWIAIPNIFVFQFAFTLMAPIMDALLLFVVTSSIANLVSGTGHGVMEELSLLAVYWMVFQIFDVLAAGFAITLDGYKRSYRLLPLLVLQRFSYRQLLYFVAIQSLIAAIKGRFVGWGKLLRTGSVALKGGGVKSA